MTGVLYSYHLLHIATLAKVLFVHVSPNKPSRSARHAHSLPGRPQPHKAQQLAMFWGGGHM